MATNWEDAWTTTTKATSSSASILRDLWALIRTDSNKSYKRRGNRASSSSSKDYYSDEGISSSTFLDDMLHSASSYSFPASAHTSSSPSVIPDYSYWNNNNNVDGLPYSGSNLLLVNNNSTIIRGDDTSSDDQNMDYYSNNGTMMPQLVLDSMNMTGMSMRECSSLGSGVSIGFEVTTYLMYCSIFLLALCGNGVVCYIVCGSPRMRSVTNYFIVNLAIGDMLMATLCVPFSFVSTLILRYWPFGAALCKVINYSQAVSVFVSSYTLVAISIDRYVAIIYPLRPRMTYLQAKVIIACVWVVALLTALPIPIVSRLDQPDELHAQCDVYICTEIWPGQGGPGGWTLDGETQKYYYSMALMVFQYLIPLSALLVTYARIAIVVWGGRPPSELQGDARAQRMARSKKKVIKMMLMVVIVYTVCWIPQHTLTIVGDVHDAIWMHEYIPYVWFACHWLSMSHTCYNPVIYCWMNAKFRAGFRAVFVNVPVVGPCANRCCLPPTRPASALYSAYSGRRQQQQQQQQHHGGGGYYYDEPTAMTTRMNHAGSMSMTRHRNNSTVTSYATYLRPQSSIRSTNNNNDGGLQTTTSVNYVADSAAFPSPDGSVRRIMTNNQHRNDAAAAAPGAGSQRRLLAVTTDAHHHHHPGSSSTSMLMMSAADDNRRSNSRTRNESTSSTISSSVRIPPYRPPPAASSTASSFSSAAAGVLMLMTSRTKKNVKNEFVTDDDDDEDDEAAAGVESGLLGETMQSCV